MAELRDALTRITVPFLLLVLVGPAVLAGGPGWPRAGAHRAPARRRAGW